MSDIDEQLGQVKNVLECAAKVYWIILSQSE
jgi:ribosomal 30S subunit maturation factor RimM